VLHYSEPIGLGTWEEKDFCVNPGGVNPLEVSLIQPLSKQLTLRFPETLQDRQQFSLEVPELTDCQGNVAGKEGIRGGNIRPPSYGDLYVNEIMYFPREGKAEYLELYNPGTSYFDLQDLAIQVAKEGEAPGAPIPVSPVSRIWLPGQYLVLTSAVGWLEESYDLDPSGSWVEVEHLPALPNEGGFVYLTDRSGATVDQVLYTDQMHMDLLGDTRGISLERLSTDRSGRDPDNWHSAASLAGYATPGEKNSQVMDPNTGPELLEVDTEVFSPDNDGFQDVLHIHINTRAHGWVVSLWISDLKGYIIRQLVNNHLTAPSATYTWDGEQADGRLAGAGMYVLYLFAYHPGSGERQRKRSVIGVIYR
jgi:hypothetical protein